MYTNKIPFNKKKKRKSLSLSVKTTFTLTPTRPTVAGFSTYRLQSRQAYIAILLLHGGIDLVLVWLPSKPFFSANVKINTLYIFVIYVGTYNLLHNDMFTIYFHHWDNVIAIYNIINHSIISSKDMRSEHRKYNYL